LSEVQLVDLECVKIMISSLRSSSHCAFQNLFDSKTTIQ